MVVKKGKKTFLEVEEVKLNNNNYNHLAIKKLSDNSVLYCHQGIPIYASKCFLHVPD